MVRLDIPVPPLRPTFRYSYRSTDHEIEQLVIQAITVDDNFRREDPKVVSRRLLLSYNKVLDMYLLPGGKFLIASVKDRCNFRFYLVVYALDHPKGPRAIARVPTMMKAYNVHARFMKVFGNEDGIVLGYTRRRFRTGAPFWSFIFSNTFNTELMTSAGQTQMIIALGQMSTSTVLKISFINPSVFTYPWRK